MAAQFYCDKKNGEIDSWSIIEAKLGPKTRLDLFDFLSKENGLDAVKLGEISAKIAAQITLIATIGEEEAQKTEFHKTYLDILEKAKILAEKSPSQETQASSAQRAVGGAAAAINP